MKYTDTDFLNEQTKEQIIIFLHNTEWQLEHLRERMYKLTGCREFGNLDGMNGACVECFMKKENFLIDAGILNLTKNKIHAIIKEKEVIMKAFEAMELTKGSVKKKGILFKTKLAWFCGKLNYKIENNAELGQSDAELDNINKRNAKLYFPLMAQYYEDDGYFVCYQNSHDSYNKFRIFWDKDKRPGDLRYAYDYYTKEK